MIPNNAVVLSKDDYERLQSKKINHGNDGNIYRVGHGLLYKVYHEKKNWNSSNLLSDEVRVFKKEDFRKKKTLEVFPENYVKLRSVDAIRLAIEKQKDIHFTTLPLAPLYIENHFRGCVLKDYRYSTSIYFVQRFPMCWRLKICKQLLEQVKELLEHNIYRVDLCGKPYHKSNALFDFLTFGPVIIDNDGCSTIYTKEKVEEFYSESVRSLVGLVLELLFDYPIGELTSQMEIFEKISWLREAGIPESYLESLALQNVTLETLDTFLNVMRKSK